MKKPSERATALHRLLKGSRHPVSLRSIQEELECSESTVRRLIRGMRKSLKAPIEFADDPPGYRYTDEAYELHGHWFLPEELHALFLILQLLQTFEPGLLADALSPLGRRIVEILESLGLDTRGGNRIRFLRMASRPAGPFFGDVATALLQRRRMSIVYRAPGKSSGTLREISPQRLSYYRDKWYLDAWCHKQDSLRTFAVHRIEKASVLDVAAVDVEEIKLDKVLGSSYGIFSGEPTATAKLLFTPDRAPWIDGEIWHPQQKTQRLESGEYLLEFPYNRAEELILDILRYGPDVAVLEPLALRDAVAERLWAAAARYPRVAMS